MVSLFVAMNSLMFSSSFLSSSSSLLSLNLISHMIVHTDQSDLGDGVDAQVHMLNVVQSINGSDWVYIYKMICKCVEEDEI